MQTSTNEYLVTVCKGGRTWDEYIAPAPVVPGFDLDERLVCAAKDKHGIAAFCRVTRDQHGKLVPKGL